jgi:phage gp46-like protein
LFKRAKALRDDAYEADQVAKHALQALMDDKERKRVDELLRSVTQRGE